MLGVNLDKEIINCDKCNSPMILTKNEIYECLVCGRFVKWKYYKIRGEIYE